MSHDCGFLTPPLWCHVFVGFWPPLLLCHVIVGFWTPLCDVMCFKHSVRGFFTPFFCDVMWLWVFDPPLCDVTCLLVLTQFSVMSRSCGFLTPSLWCHIFVGFWPRFLWCHVIVGHLLSAFILPDWRQSPVPINFPSCHHSTHFHPDHSCICICVCVCVCIQFYILKVKVIGI